MTRPASVARGDLERSTLERKPAREWLWLGGGAILLVLVALVIGTVISWVRFRTAQLPAAKATSDLGIVTVLLAGLRWIALMVVASAVLGVVAYIFAWRRWHEHRSDWHLVVTKGVGSAKALRDQPVVDRDEQGAPVGETAVRILAGVNLLLLAGISTAIVVTPVGRVVNGKPAVTVPLGFAVFAGAYKLLTDWGPLKAGPRAHAGVWILVAVAAAAFMTIPLGLLLLIGVVLATFGRKAGRKELPRAPSAFVRSPLAWLMVVAYAGVGVAYYAVPPVPFKRELLYTAVVPRVGGQLGWTTSGIELVTCQGLADATSYEPRITTVPEALVRRSPVIRGKFYVDSGDRPTLATLAMRRLGISIRLPVPLGTGLRASEPTCAGAGPRALSHGTEEPALGTGVIAGPAPAGGRSNDGDLPIEQTTSTLAELAREFQPMLEVSTADLNWPVSLGAMLTERGPRGAVTCLHRKRPPRLVCPATLEVLSGSRGDSGDYLQYPTPQATSASPSPLSGEPQVELQPFQAGQGDLTGSLRQWLADPGKLNPWATGQIYFVDAGEVPPGFPGWPAHDARVPAGLLNFEYWFFYQYNYFPTAVDRHLMGGAPLGGDLVNTDLHQGDWEHVDMLIDPVRRVPEWLYVARHGHEGIFLPWATFAHDGTHPIIQAAFGDHSSYTKCGQHHRHTGVPLNDWVVCGYGRFAFPATTTPLVDLRAVRWRCWLGRFGYAGPDTISTAKDNALHQASIKYYKVAGAPTPLRQAENSKLGLCR